MVAFFVFYNAFLIFVTNTIWININKNSIPSFEMKRILAAAGYRENHSIKNSKWIFISKNKRYYKFVMPNPDYGKGLDITKSFSCLYDREHPCFVN